MSILIAIGDFFRNFLLQIPLSVARAIYVAIPLAILIWILTLPRQAMTPEGEDKPNLRPYAILALAGQIVIYLLI